MKYLLILILINFLLNNEIKALGLNDYDSFDLAENEIEIKKTPEELVEEITNRFDKLAETSVDYAEKLKLIKETSAAFLKLAIPFGALLTASLDITGKTESDEYKALKKMNNHMVYQFDRLTERITYSFEAEEMDTELREFDNFITLQLNVLAKEVLYFTDPSIAKTNEAIIDLLSYCRGSNGIVKMAEVYFHYFIFGNKHKYTYVINKARIYMDLLIFRYYVLKEGSQI
ncbi:unnamed protein product [Meloidogyne enterolobii]|uniref:Uncharacterized protein n=1 Tax=Meloidogyne enterolobii TaxID=390850 RepID=A0ACB0YHN3_MELEN